MSLRVSDLQVLMLKSQEVGKIQQAQQVNESAQQQSFAEGLIRQSEIARQTVQTLPEAEQDKIDGDRTKRERGDTPQEGSDISNRMRMILKKCQRPKSRPILY